MSNRTGNNQVKLDPTFFGNDLEQIATIEELSQADDLESEDRLDETT